MKRITALILSILVLTNIAVTQKSVKAEVFGVWKFEFGAEGAKVKDGYLHVTTDMHIINNENRPYGFIGTNAKDYRLHGGRIDGFIQQEGQVIDLVARKGGIGSAGIKDKTVTIFNNGDYYPVRFALKVPDETYYKVKVKVTTLDESKGAVASLYTERKHPIFTNKKIAPGEVAEAEFTVRTTPVYYEKSDPKGLVEDGYVNVCLLGENAALAEIEIEQLESAPVLWILGDSTVTDGGGSLPFFPLCNYTGVGSGVTKYLSENIAVVNEGEGGLSAHDNSHFNVVKDRIKEGDFLWVEYGHNHKSDGVPGYESAIGKYYDICKKVGATLVLVGPIDRINWYDANTNTWNSSLKGFSDAAEKFVKEKLDANKDDKIAFVDLNKPSLEWFGRITESGVVNGEKVTNEARLVHFYFQAPLGARDVDHTHPNDLGAENLAYLFFENADSETYPALKPLLERYKNGRAEEPGLISEEIVNMGYPANAAWPYYDAGTRAEHPLVITKVNVNEDNLIESLTCKLLDKNLLTSYAAGFVEMGAVTYQTTIESHIDNSAANNGSIYTVEFKKDNLPEYRDGLRIYMAGVDMADNDKKLPDAVFSQDYTPQEIEAYFLPGPDGAEENFDYYGYNTLTGSGEWFSGGSGECDVSLGTDSTGRTYTNVCFTPLDDTDTCSLNRPIRNLAEGISASGRYLIQTDVKVEELSDGGLAFKIANGWKNTAPFATGDTLSLFEVSGNGVVSSAGKIAGRIEVGSWGTVKCVLDTDAAIMMLSVDNGESHAIELPEYQSFNMPGIQRMNNFVMETTGAAKVDMKLSNLVGARYNLYEHIKSTLTLSTKKGEFGNVCIGDGNETRKICNAGEILTARAVPTEDGRFLGWYKDGELYSSEESVSLRMYTDASLVGVFDRQTPECDVVINYIDENGNDIKPREFREFNDGGKRLHEEMSFVLDERYKNVIKKVSEDGYDVYFFKSASRDVIECLGPKGTNEINLVFTYDGRYFEYEEFEEPGGTWGFENEVSAEGGVINLLTGVGTGKRASSVKALKGDITQAKKLTVRFDWRSNVDTSKGRSSSFDLLDRDGEYVFSLNAKGKNGLDYGVGKFADTVISSNGRGVNDWYGVVLTLDFENGIIRGSITNKNSGEVYTIAPAQIGAKNIETIRATYGYSSAGQQLDNFGFRNDSKNSEICRIVKQEGTEITVAVDGKKGDSFYIIASVFDEDKLLGVVTRKVTVTKDGTTELTIDTIRKGQVKISAI